MDSVCLRLPHGLRRLTTLVLAALMIGCTPTMGPSVPPPASASANASLSQAEFEDSRRLRKEWGLRFDEAWIRAVAQDPASVTEFGVPMMPSEVDEMYGRAREADAVKAVVRSYAAGVADDWAGMFVDQQGGGIVIAQFAENVEAHRAALRALMHPDAAFEVRLVRWSLAQLEADATQVEADLDWFPSIDAVLYAADVDPMANQVRVRILSDNPAASELVLAHFGEGPLYIESDLPPWSGPIGALTVLVLDVAGRPVPSVLCKPVATAPGAGLGDSGLFSDANGICSFDPLPASTFRIEIQDQVDGGWITIGEGVASVPPDGDARITIVTTKD